MIIINNIRYLIQKSKNNFLKFYFRIINHIEGGNTHIINFQSENTNRPEKIKKESFQCKICFRSDSDITDPLLTPCKCCGSMSYIHFKCLKQCIKVRISKKEAENYICYLWKNYLCEICLNEYPKIIIYKDIIYEIIDFDIPYEKYIIFDYNLYDDGKKKTFRKGIIIVKIVENENITIGRNQNNIIKLKDISVSRSHCHIFKKENKIYVADKSSKFGTLLYLNKPFTITLNKDNLIKRNNNRKNHTFIDNHVNLISGKNYFTFKVESSWSLFGNLFSNTFCCKYKTSSNEDFVFNLDSIIDDKDKKFNNNDHLSDSYNDYCMCLDTIIKNSETIVKDSYI
jgi:hypothetical protein